MATSPLGRNLRSAREARQWSRETLARESGTSVATIARTELNASYTPGVSHIYAWAQALEIEPGALLPLPEPSEASA